DVAALEPAGAVHGREPAADVAEEGDGAAEAAIAQLEQGVRLAADQAQDAADAGAMVELLGADELDVLAFGGVAHGGGVAAVGEGGAELAGEGQLKQAHEAASVSLLLHRTCPSFRNLPNIV